MKARSKRVVLLGLAIGALATAVAMALSVMKSNLVFYVTPSEVAAGVAPARQRFRMGGLVESGSLLQTGEKKPVFAFVITDGITRVPVHYQGILPDMFKEGKGAVVQGELDGAGMFRADEVLAKHDENYMPPEAAHAVKLAGAGASRSTAAKEAP